MNNQKNIIENFSSININLNQDKEIPKEIEDKNNGIEKLNKKITLKSDSEKNQMSKFVNIIINVEDKLNITENNINNLKIRHSIVIEEVKKY
jgi:hypothetical protein